MKKYNLINNCLGWAVFAIASIVYLMTAEPTASWWDCGEYIATTAKLQVGHPPGAPTFQLIGRLFSLLAGGDVTKVAHLVNSMSALCSGFTILFLFWSITMLAKKLVPDKNNITTAQLIAIFGSGVIGSLAYTFSDTFWYSAVEGEVYAMSSCFTAIVFWAILKWESQAEDIHNLRWIVLISFLIGVAIGVHLLNILTIPAIVYIIYFKKYQKTNKKGLILSGILSIVLVAIVMYFIIPQLVNLASHFEIFFVNSIGMPFNSGTIIYFLLLFGLIIWGLMWSKKKMKPIFNTAVLSFLFLILGYSTFFTLIIRANANTPLNENAPKDAVSLLTYLNREQYGYTPLLYGPYFNAQAIKQDDGSPKYIKDNVNKKYIEVKQSGDVEWDESKCTVFPRMYSNDEGRNHPVYYRMWSGMGESLDRKPTFGENLTYFFRYQVNHMYWRYFMWNFVGRQNDIQSFGLNYSSYEPANVSNGTKDLIHGNWISGIKFLDASRLGPQANMPNDLANNKGRNTLFFLPLILGLCGLIYHIKKNGKDAFVVFLLFFMTGLAIVLYLNQPPCQPRERDYAYAGSFYAFAIWIGLGVFAIIDWLKKIKQVPDNIKAAVVSVVCLFAVPILMASQEWDDHDRSQRYATRDFAKNYLESCDKNAILITFGDNDTFPLWYAQDVEGIRTDVRVLNYTLSGMNWYVEQLYNKVYESDKINFTLTKNYYGLGRDVSAVTQGTDTMTVVDALKKIMSDPQTTQFTQGGDSVKVLPTNNFVINFDKAKMAAKGIYPKEDVDGNPGKFSFSININSGEQSAYLYRQELMLLDIMGTNGFDRPIYTINPNLIKKVFPNIVDYCRQEGLVYRIVPYQANGHFDADKSYDKFMSFTWGNVNKPDVYLEDAVTINNSKAMRQNFAQLAKDLIANGEKAKAIKLLDKAQIEFPNSKIPFDKSDIMLASAYCDAGAMNKGLDVYTKIVNYYKSYINYYNQFTGKKARSIEGDKQMSIFILAQVHSDATRYGFTNLANQIKTIPGIDGALASVDFQNQYQQLGNNINNAASILRSNGNKQQATTILKQALSVVEKAAQSNNEQITNELGQIMQFVYGLATKYSLDEILKTIQSSPTLSNMMQSKNNLSMQQQSSQQPQADEEQEQ